MLATLRLLGTPANDQPYRDYRFALLSQLEGNHLLPYLDSRGIPTIGIGVMT